MTEFLSYDPWLRDNFRCTSCGSIPRHRALLKILELCYPNWSQLTIHESSPSGGGASARLKAECREYLASQYFPDKPFGSLIDGYRNENLEALTFSDKSADIVITQDVLEHVYDPRAVFREVARILRPGGAHIFTVPIVNKHRPTQLWATKNADGTPQFLHEPEFHGNPVDPKGSPVTMHWGYDIVDYIRDACGLNTVIEYVDDLSRGIRADYSEVLITRRPAEVVHEAMRRSDRLKES
jgi:SAM-dependent methyltransferase